MDAGYGSDRGTSLDYDRDRVLRPTKSARRTPAVSTVADPVKCPQTGQLHPASAGQCRLRPATQFVDRRRDLLALVLVLLAALVFGLPHDGASTPAPGSPLASIGTRQHAKPKLKLGALLARPDCRCQPAATDLRGQPTAGFDAFLLHVPEALRASCQPAESSDQSVLFSANCATTDGITVTYAQYADATSMDAAYQAAFTAQQIDPDTGSCDVHTTWPAESAYQVEGQPGGRRLCADVQSSPTICGPTSV